MDNHYQDITCRLPSPIHLHFSHVTLLALLLQPTKHVLTTITALASISLYPLGTKNRSHAPDVQFVDMNSLFTTSPERQQCFRFLDLAPGKSLSFMIAVWYTLPNSFSCYRAPQLRLPLRRDPEQPLYNHIHWETRRLRRQICDCSN